MSSSTIIMGSTLGAMLLRARYLEHRSSCRKERDEEETTERRPRLTGDHD